MRNKPRLGPRLQSPGWAPGGAALAPRRKRELAVTRRRNRRCMPRLASAIQVAGDAAAKTTCFIPSVKCPFWRTTRKVSTALTLVFELWRLGWRASACFGVPLAGPGRLNADAYTGVTPRLDPA